MSSRSLAGFIGRVVAYLVVIGLALALANALWNFLDLDRNDALAALRAEVTPLLAGVPVVCALLAGIARPLGVFTASFVVGALLTAPFALLHAVAR